jgi:hypothetical protein
VEKTKQEEQEEEEEEERCLTFTVLSHAPEYNLPNPTARQRGYEECPMSVRSNEAFSRFHTLMVLSCPAV